MYQSGSSFSGMFVVSVTAQTGADLAAIEAAVTAELTRVRAEPITDVELARGVTRTEAGVVWGLQSLMARANLL
ncbi:MAG: insulinase family protein, partial [Deltaproteobacteria bacterium]|nr:insulinase family protein [Deltaproteobacteria bacterium]